MVRVNLVCQLKSQQHTMLHKFLADNLNNVRRFTGCLRVDIYFDESQNIMLIDEDWQSIEAHQHYMQFIANNGVLKQLSAYFTVPPQILYLSKSPL
ncbi:putative quinol monooxygenase [Pseudoalteromonas sp. MMG012]|uniref:putative quinol monooxygenase n=1 Tax=Pseudoalteromonas sp. MMG012 TaxID=2822686 RepID=UPI001B3A1C43|nr:hypothetical protein [Pseudoalteromonas sp. MMG012]MBQ4850836.1 hypothetical protein [Pseudoalteromonas sp. MMG012]